MRTKLRGRVIPENLRTPEQRRNWLRRTWRELLIDQYEGCFAYEIAALRLAFRLPIWGSYGPMCYDTPELFHGVVRRILGWSPLDADHVGV